MSSLIAYDDEGNGWDSFTAVDEPDSQTFVLAGSLAGGPTGTPNTFSMAGGAFTAVSDSSPSPTFTGESCPEIGGPVSGSFVVATRLLTLVYPEPVDTGGSYIGSFVLGNTGSKYALDTYVSGAGTTTLVIHCAAASGSGTPDHSATLLGVAVSDALQLPMEDVSGFNITVT